MKLIVGLGNPEDEANYANTRHNMGFNVINLLAQKYNIEINKKKYNGLYGTGVIEGEKVILLKPQTYMNLSGEAVIQFMNFYKLTDKDLIVIYDDIDIEPGKIRIKRNGSASTHNGMKSVVKCLSSENFERVRVGIGKPDINIDLMYYVIGPVSDTDKTNLKEGVNKAEEAVVTIIKDGIETAMNLFN